MAELFDTGRIAGRQPFVHGAHNLSGAVEWYTPKEYIDSARKVMGSIDCDPATSELAQKMIQAKTYYTIEEDGLAHPWGGNVWLNPPYASKVIVPFVDRLIGLLDKGGVSQAILLTHNNVDTAWFHKAAMRSRTCCFTRGRVRFYNAAGKANSPTHGHVFLYFGRRAKAFAREFVQYGWICTGAEA